MIKNCVEKTFNNCSSEKGLSYTLIWVFQSSGLDTDCEVRSVRSYVKVRRSEKGFEFYPGWGGLNKPFF